MRIICLTPTFPTKTRFWRGTFVANFCLELEKLGAEVRAVVPEGWHAIVEKRLREAFYSRGLKKEKIETIAAGYPSFSILARHARWLSNLNRKLCRRSVERQLDRLSPKPDVIYAHFITSGLHAVDWCRRKGVTLAVVSGESSYDYFLKWMNKAEVLEQVEAFDKLLFVSERNQRELKRFLGTDKQLGSILGNAVDAEKFLPGDKGECRRKLGLPQDKVLGIFVGSFIERKGPFRVLEAMERVEGVNGVFIGRGNQRPKGETVAYVGLVENDDMPVWLGAVDFFVLPSFEEGRSNAVLEALACGLPLIVSDRPFNREFLDEKACFFVDPESVEAIAAAIRALVDQPMKRTEMGRSAREQSLKFSQRERARRFFEIVDRSQSRSNGSLPVEQEI